MTKTNSESVTFHTWPRSQTVTHSCTNLTHCCLTVLACFMNCDILKAKQLLGSSVAVLPDCTNNTDLANTFCKFFYDKILKIRSTLQSSTPSSVTRPNSKKNALSSFTPVSEEDLLTILKSSPSKSCDLDPIPTSLVKECGLFCCGSNHTFQTVNKKLK